MFTGIIEAVGEIKHLEPKGDDFRLEVATGKLDMTDVQLGDSIAVNGVCLTVVAMKELMFSADISAETLRKTNFAHVKAGSPANLEKALTPTTRLGGHLVSGHVDGLGKIVERFSEGRSERFRILAPDELAKYIAVKGSICVDGTSLTVNQVSGSVFDLNIVPHTLSETTMGDFKVGREVNLEVDIIARYLERLLLGEKAAVSGGALTEAFLAEHGFVK